MIGIVYSVFTFLPLILISVILFAVCTVAAYEFINLAGFKLKPFLVIVLNGLVIASYFTFDQPGLREVVVFIILSNGIFFLFYENKKEKLESFIKDISTNVFTLFYLYIPLYFIYKIIELGKDDGTGANIFFFLVLVIAVGDTGAYFFGKLLGRHKIYKIASPNKTLEGVIAAIITGGLSGWLAIFILNINTAGYKVVLTGALMGLLSQISDPVESLFKRAAGKKDSGKCLPGHGGILDRIDSYIFCTPVFFYMVIHFWK
jgi:phosphatidate cytidylyltransferase